MWQRVRIAVMKATPRFSLDSVILIKSLVFEKQSKRVRTPQVKPLGRPQILIEGIRFAICLSN